MEYKMIDTSTIEGVNEADQLINQGWEIYRSGLFLVYFQKRVKK